MCLVKFIIDAYFYFELIIALRMLKIPCDILKYSYFLYYNHDIGYG